MTSPTDDPIVEHALGDPAGTLQLRNTGDDRVWPLNDWIATQQQYGPVYRRRVIVVEDWHEVPR